MVEDALSRIAALTGLEVGREAFIERVLSELLLLGFERARWLEIARDTMAGNEVLVRTATVPSESVPRNFATIEVAATNLRDSPVWRTAVTKKVHDGSYVVEIPVTANGQLDAIIACEAPGNSEVLDVDLQTLLGMLGVTVGAQLALRSTAAVSALRERRRDLSNEDPHELIVAAAADLGTLLHAANVAVFELMWTDSMLVKVHEWTPSGAIGPRRDEHYRVGDSLTGSAWQHGGVRHIIHVPSLFENQPSLVDNMVEHWTAANGDASLASTVLFAVVGRLDRRFLVRLVNRFDRPELPFLEAAGMLEALVADLSSDFDAALANQRSRNLQRLSGMTAGTLAPNTFVDRLETAMSDEGIDDFIVLCHQSDSPQLGFAAFRGSRLAESHLTSGYALDVDPLCAATMGGEARVIRVPSARGSDSELSALLRGAGFGCVLTLPIRMGKTGGALLIPLVTTPHGAGRKNKTLPDDCSRRTVSMLQSYAQLVGAVVETFHASAAADGARRALGLIGHELRGPLAALGSSAELAIIAAQRALSAAPGLETAAELETLEDHHEQLWQRQHEVNAALELAPLVAEESVGSLQLHFTKKGLGDVLELTITDLLSELRRDRVSEHRYAFEALPSVRHLGEIVADPTFLRHAFKNILRNAVKYSLPRHPPKPMKIELFCERQVGFVAVKIRNWGFGIPEERRDLIFEPWVRGELVDHVKAIRGMGLGLFLARRIVTAHRGEILFQSTATLDDGRRTARLEGFETTFEVRIPRDLPAGTYVHRW